MKNSALILFLTLFFISFNVSSQVIKGKIVNNEKQAIEGANIYIQRLYLGTATDSKGNFRFKLRKTIRNQDTIVISHINYKTLKISFSDLKSNLFIVKLTSNFQSLDEVTIKTKKERLKTYLAYKKLTPLEKGLYGFGHTVVNNTLYIIGGNASDKFDGLSKEVSLDPNISRFAGRSGGVSMQDILSELDGELEWKRFNGNLYTYNMDIEKWNTSPLKFIKRAYHNVHYYNGKLLTLGGKTLSANRRFEYLENKIEEYSIKKHTIAIDKANPHKAVKFSSFIYKDKLIVLGGSNKQLRNGQKRYNNEIHVYDLKSGYWYRVGYMPVPKETNGILVDSTIYLFGGFNGRKLKNIESYNLKNGRWKIEGSLFKEDDKLSLTSHEHIIYIYTKNRILTFNTLTKELDQYLIGIDVVEPEIFYRKGKIYLLGGYQNQNDFRIEPSVDFYSIDIREFEKTRLNKYKTF